MAVSVTSTAWQTGRLVAASGTIAEVNAEMAAGAVSHCPLKISEFLLGYGGSTAGNCVACWYYKA